jgi:ABC-2 type transport system permease protein
MRALWAIVHNETVQLYRDKLYLFLLTVGGMASLVIMAYALSADIENVDTLVVDLDRSRESRQFIQMVMNDDFFALNFVSGRNEAEQYLQDGLAKIALIIPADYSQRLSRSETVQIQVLIDGSVPSIAELAHNHISALTSNHSQRLIIQKIPRQGNSNALSLTFHPRIRYNTELKTIVSVMPGLMSIILAVSAVGAASAFGRERERGTLEMLICSPLGRWPLLLGRVFPYLVIGLFDVIVFALMGYFAFHVPMRGSLLLFILLSSVYLFAITSAGVFIAQFLDTQHTAMLVTFMLFGISPSYLSDIFFPVTTMPTWLQQEAAMTPATHFTVIARGIFLKGAGWEALWPNTMTLLATGVLMSVLAYLKFQKKLG